MENQQILIEASDLSGIIHSIIEHAYYENETEINDVFELVDYVSEEDFKVSINKTGNLTMTNLHF